MRGILFRGKRKGNGEWIEGYYAQPTYYLDDRDFHIIFPLNFVAYPHCEFSDYEEVIPETVGRFTGLDEKNGNGKKIFEGDIICIPFTEDTEYGEHTYYEYGVVYFDEKYLAWCVKFDDGETMFLEEYDDCATVTGNIHDNPEFLKGAELI